MSINIEQHQFRSPLFESVVEQAIKFILETPLQILPPEAIFQGVGVYCLYLNKHENIYKDIADPTSRRPIYVGKAVPLGWRTARSARMQQSLELSRRLREHANSILYTRNLTLDDFRCRFMILTGIETDLIIPIEAQLIRYFRPLWNTTIDGFGNHDPGGGRYNQARSEWDTLHPGRPWVQKLLGTSSDIASILFKIEQYRLDLKP